MKFSEKVIYIYFLVKDIFYCKNMKLIHDSLTFLDKKLYLSSKPGLSAKKCASYVSIVIW